MSQVAKTILVCAFLFGCQKSSPPSQPVLAEEYAVYSCIVSTLVDSSRYQIVFVNDSTLRNDPVPARPNVFREFPPGSYAHNSWLVIRRHWPDFDSQKFEIILNQVNKICYHLNVDLIQSAVSVRRRDWLKINESEYADLYSEGKVAILWLSRVASNESATEALVYSDFACGYLCGAGRWFWLKKQSGSWKVHKSIEIWVS